MQQIQAAPTVTPLNLVKVSQVKAPQAPTDNVKRSTIFQEIRSMKYDVLLMQEMGCVSQEHFHSWAAELNAVGVISLSPEPYTRGTGILINKNLGATIQNKNFT